MELRQLKQIAALGQHRSFAQAARALGMSQPALSKGIRLLEEALAVRLFDRSARGVTPTLVGRLLLSRADPVLRSVGDLMEEVERLKGLSAGALSIGAAFYPYEISAGPAFCRMTRRHPELNLRIIQGHWRSLTQLVVAGDLDLAVAEVAVAEREPSLHVERLGSRHGVFFCRAGHPLDRSGRLAFTEVARHSCAFPPVPTRMATFLTRAKVRGRIDPATGDFTTTVTVDSIGLMKRVILESEAIGWAPRILLATEMAAGTLVALDVEAPWVKLDYGVIRLRDRASTPAEEAFVAELRNVEQEVSAAEGADGWAARRAEQPLDESSRASRAHRSPAREGPGGTRSPKARQRR
jgi:DNA-binding transcriptional LysR family regulator